MENNFTGISQVVCTRKSKQHEATDYYFTDTLPSSSYKKHANLQGKLKKIALFFVIHRSSFTTSH